MPRAAFYVLLFMAAAAQADEVERGRRLLAHYQCGSCHTIPGVESADGTVAQRLDAWRHRSYIAGRVPNRQALLAQWIRSPRSLVAGTPMPDMGVSPEDAQRMAAYLFTLE